MKKILILAAVVAMAAVSQAASVSWKATAVKDYAGANIGSTSDYVATVTFWNSKGEIVGTSSDSASTFNQYTATLSDVFANGGTYTAQLIIKNDKYEVKSSVAEFVVPDGADATINFTTGAGFVKEQAHIAYTGEGSWQAVPEPTSGLLLILGVAGLALRRKKI